MVFLAIKIPDPASRDLIVLISEDPKILNLQLIDLRARSFLRGDYQTTWGWAKVFLKALVE